MRSDRSRHARTTGQRPPTTPGGRQASDEGLAQVLGLLLRGGVMLAATIAAAGGAVYLRSHAGDAPQFQEFRGIPLALSTAARTLRAARTGDGEALIQLGLLVLIATPVTRVIVSLVGFARERNWTYVLLTALVLGALATSIVQAA